MSLFRTGFENVKEYKKIDYTQVLFDFYLKPENPATPIRFLTKDVISFTGHSIAEGNMYKTYLCTGDSSCVLCKRDEKKRELGAFLVLDGGERKYQDKEGKEQVDTDRVKIFTQGVGIILALKALNNTYGLDRTIFLVNKNAKNVTPAYLIYKENDLLTMDDYSHKDPEIWKPGIPEALESYVRSVLPERCKNMSYSDIVKSHFTVYGKDSVTVSI